MAEKKAEKVENAEYQDTETRSGELSATEILAQAGDVNAQRELNKGQDKVATESGEFKLGQPAPKSLYEDIDGKVSEKPVGEGRVLVVEGDTVTQSIVDKLNK
jgi:hypothetical protein